MTHQCRTWVYAGTMAMAVFGGAAVAAAQADAEQVKARQRISTMEGVLERAVQHGADNLLRQVDSFFPDAAMLTGPPQVRGFRLEDYGLFFDVEVPGLHVSAVWPLRVILDDTRAARAIIAELREKVAQVSPRERAGLEQVLRRLETTLPPSPAPPGAVAPATLAAAGGAPDAPPPVEPVAPDILDNPYEAWTREVKAALIDAMLENSGFLDVAEHEWLTVAARDSAPRDPLMAGGTVDFSTVIFRVRGIDLRDFHARRITTEEARGRVQIVEQ